MGCCASLLKCCVRAETENPLLDSGHSGGGPGNGQQVRNAERSPQRDFHCFCTSTLNCRSTQTLNERNVGKSEHIILVHRKPTRGI